jgi:hypothetical protein
MILLGLIKVVVVVALEQVALQELRVLQDQVAYQEP